MTLWERVKNRTKINPETNCWEWQGCDDGHGYGQIRINRKTHRTLRIVFELVNGPIEIGLDICHTCDNRRCINPEHLFKGTRLDNMRDAVVKGRMQKGEQRPLHKLTEVTVREARDLNNQGWSCEKLARKYMVGGPTMWKAVSGQTWKHVV